ncbi:type VI secretion system protein TssA [Rhodovarius crocodyli]|uniref:Type VI secretion system protein TssA n=1 Tax=Rhodovarius crocodyli TaxID=1979269 RepID=A0A437MMG6_9PROT|nr:type VI secretion system protein TssA [Rhodovarius crocodyli]RVT98829.1 type VI secretion system protein TssA [Rhodovarius crocodyli]
MNDVLDLEALLAPLDGESPSGTDLREDFNPTAPYRALRDARSAAQADDRARRSADEPDTSASPLWREVVRIATETLASVSKDLEVACWLTEALVRQHGLAGLLTGAHLLDGLLERYGDDAWPRPDEEDGQSYRASLLEGLSGADKDGVLIQPLQSIQLFMRPTGMPFLLYEHEAALAAAALPDPEKRQARYERGVVPLERLEAEAHSARASIGQTRVEVEEAMAAWRALDDRAEAMFGAFAPSLRRVSEALGRALSFAEQYGDAAAPAPVSVPEDAAAAAAPVMGAAPAMAGGGMVLGGVQASIANRDQALKQLEQIAEFFASTEPHSFLAYTLKEAVRRGRMSLPELLGEVLADETVRYAMLSALGIKAENFQETPAEEGGDGYS